MASDGLSGWLALLHMPGSGPVMLRRLHKHFGSIDKIFAASGQALQALLNAEQCQALAMLTNGAWPPALRAKVEADLQWQSASNNAVLLFDDPDYPPLLREIPDPPPILFAQGQLTVLDKPTLAMVGARKPTASGRRLARRFAEALATAGFTIVSGLAVGIDGESHRGALQGGGYTLAVLGSGLDQVYPACHRKLANSIAGQGVLLSEFPRDCRARAWHFPRRNRIVTGLSLGVLVVEAALKSGSLISARCAMEQGREVFAIPGPIDNLQSRGCHALIRDGATLVESPADVGSELQHWCEMAAASSEGSCRELGKGAAGKAGEEIGREVIKKAQKAAEPVPLPAQASARESLTQDEAALLAIMGYDRMQLDRLVLLSGHSPARIAGLLTSLELKGKIEQQAGAYSRRDGDAGGSG